MTEIVGWYVRVTTSGLYDGVYNTLLYVAGFNSPDDAVDGVRAVRHDANEQYEVLDGPVTPGVGPQPSRGEIRLLEGAH